MSTPSPRVQVPRSATKGDVIQIKALIEHKMETGLRRDENGEVIPRKIINQFICRYHDEIVFSVDLREAVAANPYFEFYLRATTSGPLDFIWIEDGGRTFALKHHLVVG